MTRIVHLISFASCLVLFAACGSETIAPTADGGARADGGGVSPDGGGVTADGGGVTADGGSVVADGGSAADGGNADAGAPDAGAPDAGAADGGVLAGCAATYASCGTYTDLTAAGASRNIAFSGTSYSPACIRIKAGQSVSFNGTFLDHPLRNASCSPAASVITSTGTGTTKSFTFPSEGRHGYWCNNHGSDTGFGMAGAIEVVP